MLLPALLYVREDLQCLVLVQMTMEQKNATIKAANVSAKVVLLLQEHVNMQLIVVIDCTNTLGKVFISVN